MSDLSAGVPRFLTVAEVADLMRVSKMTVYRMVHSGDLPAVRMGRSFRVPQKAVEELVALGLAEWESGRAVGEEN
ncbi:MAG: helix-turn-helix domain-containing protein [bacterium]|nr:helix-turn-helix domain-containing protein [bacterium]